ncbi:MAG: hypothetical protein COS85_11665 [Armatimonadetes bacterium CG07_land_8_20_14_0_80_59_28]|nr:MAG: hypothetical protein COS85_11665 [Armatimonadetes bacterium CG07_land_8_20_14_0_80_59_28]PIY38623.1 MAG: hypothetical protein COZ05_20490 [Armatimonadetes bacterium CG_4_10_14_3_um_filter_59_10]
MATTQTGSFGTLSTSALGQSITDMDAPQLMRPLQPTTLKESGISVRVVEGLILKTIKQEGSLSEQQLAEMLRLSVNVFRDMVQALLHRELLDTPAPLHYDLTNKGRELCHHYESEDAYVGPAPVSFQSYVDMVQLQAKSSRRVTQEEVTNNFQKFPMRPELLRILKEGFNSQRVIIFWGPPGNGKSLVTDNLHRLLKDPVCLPYAFEFNGRVVQIYDPAYHKLREDLMVKEEEETNKAISAISKPDRRWLISTPPLVTVGTEFRVEHFQIAYDGKYDAPPHVKANNGIFIFDDLGRQTQDHNMILNQFIYPLEQQEAIIKFAGGSSIRAPYKQRLFLSTNLNFRAIIDDAFARRLLFQVLVDRPTDELFTKIFINQCKDQDIDDAIAQRLGRKLLGWYKRDGRVVRAADPRNIFTMLDAVLEEEEQLKDMITDELFERIYNQYPIALEKDATGYVIPQATAEEFHQSVLDACDRHEVDHDLAARLADNLLEWFQRDGRMFRPQDPDNIFAILDGIREDTQGVKDILTEELFESVYQSYPPFTEADAERMQGTVGLGGH